MPLNLLQKEDRLIRDVYPKSKLLASEPNSQELSRLTYHLSNKPSKLNHIASEVTSKADTDARKAGSNARSKASLMVTLQILKSLCEECRRDLPLFAYSVLKAVGYALDVKLAPNAGPTTAGVDLEILARASSVFRAFTTYTLLPPDTPALAALYHSVLRRFAKLAILADDKADDEMVLRIRLLALAAISSSVSSDVLGGREYQTMVEVIVGSLLGCCEHVAIADLLQQSEKEPSSSHPITTYSAPELRLRRAQSVHHVPGLPGPTQAEISQAAISSFRTLVQHANGPQLGIVVEVLCSWLDRAPGRWVNRDWVSGLLEGMAAWGGVQYRFVLPSTLAELLLALRDDAQDDVKRSTLLAALTRLLDSQLSLIGLSPSTLLGSLLMLLLRQPSPDVLGAIGALAGKVYYKDQNIDFVEEILGRLDSASGPDRLLALLDAAKVILASGKIGAESGGHATVGERNTVPPEVVGQSIYLLSHPSPSVRSAYASLVTTYILSELPSGDNSGDKRLYKRLFSVLFDLLQTPSSPSAGQPISTSSSPRQRRVSLLINSVQPEPSDYKGAAAMLVAIVQQGGPTVVCDIVGLVTAVQPVINNAGSLPFDRVWQALGERYASNVSTAPLDKEGARTRVTALAASQTLQEATELNRQMLEGRLLVPYSPTSVADRTSMIESSPAIKPEGSLTGDTASMHSFAWAGGAGSSKRREGLGVGDLREALTGRSSLSTTHLAPSMSSIHSPSVRGAGSIKTGGGRSRTLRNKPDDVADLFRRLGIGKEGRKGKNVASSRSVSGNGVTSRHPTGANGEGRILKAEDLELGPVIKTQS